MTRVEDSAAYQRGVDWRRGRTKPEPMNWIQQLLHRHNFFPTTERRPILGDMEAVAPHEIYCEVIGEIHVEVCNSCGAKRCKAYRDHKLASTWIEGPDEELAALWRPYPKP